MKADKTLARHLGRVLEKLTRQSGRLPETSAYGSWLLGRSTEGPRRRRVRTQFILTLFIGVINLVGIAVALLLVLVAVPEPSVLDAPDWVFYVMAAYVVYGFGVGTWWLTRQTVNSLRWAIEGRHPTVTDQRNVFLTPWRVAVTELVLWGVATVLSATLYGLQDTDFIPRFIVALGIIGAMVAMFAYLVTEFTLRPVAAQALEAGPAPRRFAPGIMGRLMTVWLLGSGLPVIGIALTAFFVLLLRNLSQTEFAVAVLISAAAALVSGFVLNWIAAWITVTPVRVVRAALEKVENGDLSTNLIAFDGTELGELQRGFNSMVDGLRERERVRDLFGRHVGREVAAAAEAEQTQLGGEERYVAIVFVDIIGSTALVTTLAAWEVVTLLNRFFAVVVSEVERQGGLLNKFEGDGCLAIFGAPNDLDRPEDAALTAARTVAARLGLELPELSAGIGVAAGEVVAGNVGAHERFEYTVIGEPVNEAARLCELAKSVPGRVVATSRTVDGASESVRAQWVYADSVALRGIPAPVPLAVPKF